jgi:hypothetical protein
MVRAAAATKLQPSKQKAVLATQHGHLKITNSELR